MYRDLINMLIQIFNQDAFLNLILSSYLTESKLNDHQKKLFTKIIYGVCDKKIYLDYLIFKEVIINFIIIYLTSKISSQAISLKKMVISSIDSMVLSLVVLFFSIKIKWKYFCPFSLFGTKYISLPKTILKSGFSF